MSPAAFPAATLDPGLPQLAGLTTSSGASDLLGRLLGRSLRVLAVTAVKHRPGRRCILRVALDPDGIRPAPADAVVYLKVYGTDRAASVGRRTATCAALQVGGPQVQLPPVLAVAPELGLVVIGGLRGEPFLNRLAAGQPGLTGRMAEAMAHLHAITAAQLPGDTFPRHDARRELAPLAARLRDLEATCPPLAGHARAARQSVERVHDRAERLPWRWRLLHRDLHPGQVLVDGSRLAIVDWDDAALGEPAVDLANFAAHLRLAAMTTADTALAARFRRAAVSMVAWGRRLDPQLSPDLLRLLEATTLLRLICIHRGRSLSLAAAGRLLRREGRMLNGAWERLTDDRPRG
ncbi:MAG: phosphotransferase family protein [Anaerolineae bacterium]|nr:aminoglycoside phosphotransferase family protein [Ardenticatenia bacterium]HQZ70208.1 aminoglycoside phosphotransferase family protein [Anaerolineae bacterium]HRA19396.1 aminoglycoside phosphotransferase family protein [Anaerolineae bacterium]